MRELRVRSERGSGGSEGRAAVIRERARARTNECRSTRFCARVFPLFVARVVASVVSFVSPLLLPLRWRALLQLRRSAVAVFVVPSSDSSDLTPVRLCVISTG